MLLPKNLALIIIFSLVVSGVGVIGWSLVDQIACEGQPFNNNEAPTDEQRLFGDRLIGQTFVAPRDGLNRIDIMFLTYGNNPTPAVEWRLLNIPDELTGLSEGIEVSNGRIEAGMIQNYAWVSIDLAPISDSAQKNYLITLSAPEADFDEAITVGGIERNVYTPGTAFFGPTPVPADIAFRTCYEMSVGERLKVLTEQITYERPGLLGNIGFYGVILVVYVGLLGIFFWRLINLKV